MKYYFFSLLLVGVLLFAGLVSAQTNATIDYSSIGATYNPLVNDGIDYSFPGGNLQNYIDYLNSFPIDPLPNPNGVGTIPGTQSRYDKFIQWIPSVLSGWESKPNSYEISFSGVSTTLGELRALVGISGPTTETTDTTNTNPTNTKPNTTTIPTNTASQSAYVSALIGIINNMAQTYKNILSLSSTQTTPASSDQISYVQNLTNVVSDLTQTYRNILYNSSNSQTTSFGVTNPEITSFSATVTVYANILNVRSAPNTQAEIIKQLSRGAVFRVKATVKGQNVEGTDDWWLTEDNAYIWAGGTSIVY